LNVEMQNTLYSSTLAKILFIQSLSFGGSLYPYMMTLSFTPVRFDFFDFTLLQDYLLYHIGQDSQDSQESTQSVAKLISAECRTKLSSEMRN